MLQDGLISRSCLGGAAALEPLGLLGERVTSKKARSSHSSRGHGRLDKGGSAAVPETWAIMKQASFEPNTVSPRGPSRTRGPYRLGIPPPSPHCFPRRSCLSSSHMEERGRRGPHRRRRRRRRPLGPHRRRRRRPPGPSRGAGAGARAPRPGQRERTLPEPGRVDGGPPGSHTRII